MSVINPTSYAGELQQANELDPLMLGRDLVDGLPYINQVGDSAMLIRLANRAVEMTHETDFGTNPRVADAALRDVDFISSSLLRMGQRLSGVDGLIDTMDSLGRAAGTVPRGTVYTYAVQNPEDLERTFTGTAEEKLFIKTVRDSGVIMLAQCAELLSLDAANDTPAVIAEALSKLTDGMRQVVRGMVDVSRVVSPSFFSGNMRPFFDGIEVNGVTYAGAGGAQLPLVVIDRIIWGSDSDSAVYQAYYDDNIRYQPASVRSDLEMAQQQASVVESLERRFDAGEDIGVAAAEAQGAMSQIKRFRMPHRKVAQDNFKLRPQGSVGSGQYTPSVLDTLIGLTEVNISRLGKMQQPSRVIV